jgi:hypothetical protein
MGIVCEGRCPNNMESCAIVDYHHHKFKYVDRHEHAIVIVGLGSECTLKGGPTSYLNSPPFTSVADLVRHLP